MSGVSSETVKLLLVFEKKLKDDADEATLLEGSGVLATLMVSCRKRGIGTKEGRGDGKYENEVYVKNSSVVKLLAGD